MCWFYISRCLPFPCVDSPSVHLCAGIARKFIGIGNRKLHWLWGAVGLDTSPHMPSPGSFPWELLILL